MLPKPQRPTCPSLTLCLDARQRPDTTFDLFGVFTTLSIAVFPLKLHLFVHYTLLDGQGRYLVELGAAADADEHAQRACRHEVTLSNPLHVRDGVATLDMMIARPGLFWVRLYANDDCVGQRPFEVREDSP